jgi:predicted transcriptional regulator
MLLILEICSENGGVNKTKIVYQTNLNFKVATLYLDMLIKEEMIEVKNPGPGKSISPLRKEKIFLSILKMYTTVWSNILSI